MPPAYLVRLGLDCAGLLLAWAAGICWSGRLTGRAGLALVCNCRAGGLSIWELGQQCCQVPKQVLGPVRHAAQGRLLLAWAAGRRGTGAARCPGCGAEPELGVEVWRGLLGSSGGPCKVVAGSCLRPHRRLRRRSRSGGRWGPQVQGLEGACGLGWAEVQSGQQWLQLGQLLLHAPAATFAAWRSSGAP